MPSALQIAWDFVKVLVPFGWGITSLAAVVAYGAAERVGPSLMALFSAVASFAAAVDVYIYHRCVTRDKLASEWTPAGHVWATRKMVLVLLLACIGLVFTIVFLAVGQKGFDSSDPIWSAIATIVCAFWSFDLYFHHYRKGLNATPPMPTGSEAGGGAGDSSGSEASGVSLAEDDDAAGATARSSKSTKKKSRTGSSSKPAGAVTKLDDDSASSSFDEPDKKPAARSSSSSSSKKKKKSSSSSRKAEVALDSASESSATDSSSSA